MKGKNSTSTYILHDSSKFSGWNKSIKEDETQSGSKVWDCLTLKSQIHQGINHPISLLPNASILVETAALSCWNKNCQHWIVNRVSIHYSVPPSNIRTRVYGTYSHSARRVAEDSCVKEYKTLNYNNMVTTNTVTRILLSASLGRLSKDNATTMIMVTVQSSELNTGSWVHQVLLWSHLKYSIVFAKSAY